MDYRRMPTGRPSGDAKDLVEMTLPMIIDAYRKTGLGVLKGGFLRGGKACPVAAVVEAAATDWSIRKVTFSKYTEAYLRGFAAGFDGAPREDLREKLLPKYVVTGQWEYDQGYAFGVEVAQAIDAGVLEEVPDYPPESCAEPAKETSEATPSLLQ